MAETVLFFKLPNSAISDLGEALATQQPKKLEGTRRNKTDNSRNDEMEKRPKRTA